MTDSPEARLAELGLELPAPPKPAASYLAWTRTGNTVFSAGQIPVRGGAVQYEGRLGAELTTEQGVAAAELCALNLLAVGKAAAGALHPLRVVKLTVFVASTPEFTEQHLVANGASDLVAKVFGERGLHARSAVGVAALPLGCAVEVEGIFELDYEAADAR